MVILKKIKSTTLIEVIVATIIVVIIFMIASLILNNLLLNSFNKKEYKINYRLNQLEYKINNHSINLPYTEKYQNWKIEIVKIDSKTNYDIISLQSRNDRKIKLERKINIEKIDL